MSILAGGVTAMSDGCGGCVAFNLPLTASMLEERASNISSLVAREAVSRSTVKEKGIVGFSISLL